jgi:hypothetical protein
MVKLFDALWDAESLTLAMRPAVPEKLTVPEMTPVLGSMVSPSTNSAVVEIGEIDHVNAPTPFAAVNVAE